MFVYFVNQSITLLSYNTPQQTQHNYELRSMPRLEDIGRMLEPDLSYYFFLFLQLDNQILDKVKKLCISNFNCISADILPQLNTLLLALIYLSRHFSSGLWLEFYYALFANIMLIGHLDVEMSQRDDNDNGKLAFCAPMLKLDREDHLKLVAKLEPFVVPVPNFWDAYATQPRFVHQYNAYQNCLSHIIFLASILRSEKG